MSVPSLSWQNNVRFLEQNGTANKTFSYLPGDTSAGEELSPHVPADVGAGAAFRSDRGLCDVADNAS